MINPYPAPDATPLQVIAAEIAWLEERVHAAERLASAAKNQIACFETRIQDLRRQLVRLEREDLDPNPLGRME